MCLDKGFPIGAVFLGNWILNFSNKKTFKKILSFHGKDFPCITWYNWKSALKVALGRNVYKSMGISMLMKL